MLCVLCLNAPYFLIFWGSNTEADLLYLNKNIHSFLFIICVCPETGCFGRTWHLAWSGKAHLFSLVFNCYRVLQSALLNYNYCAVFWHDKVLRQVEIRSMKCIFSDEAAMDWELYFRDQTMGAWLLSCLSIPEVMSSQYFVFVFLKNRINSATCCCAHFMVWYLSGPDLGMLNNI